MKSASIALACLSALALSACGGGGGGGGSSPTASGSSSSAGSSSSSSESGTSSSSSSASSGGAVLTGVFLDSAIEGLKYSTASGSGVTNAAGTFNYKAGELITFSLYDTVLDATKASAVLTPGDLKDLPDPHYTLNLIRVLLAADADGDPTNGIQLASTAVAETWNFNLNQSITTFSSDATFLAFAAKYSKFVNLQNVVNAVPNAADATSHFNSTIHNTLQKQLGVNAVFPVVGRKMTYSVKSDFCSDPNAWYGNMQVTMTASGYKLAGGWSNLTTQLNSTSSGPYAAMTCSTLSQPVNPATVFGYGMFSSPGVVAYKNVGNNTWESMLNDVADWNYVDVNGNKGIVWAQYELQSATDTYGRKYVEMYWKRDSTLYRVRTYYAAGTDPTYGNMLGTVTEKYAFQ